jgi:hypothetical protein
MKIHTVIIIHTTIDTIPIRIIIIATIQNTEITTSIITTIKAKIIIQMNKIISKIAMQN